LAWSFTRNTPPTGTSTQISRFEVSAGNADIADPTSEVSILQVSQPVTNHNAGDLAFGPDGYLYIPLGDGGGAGDPNDRAQDGSLLLGKMLRIDVDGGDPYSIPPDNPFVGNPEVLDEIWAIGFRNPWRFSFDRETGDMYIADVGQSSREEVDFQPFDSGGGENYGWRCYEGSLEYNTDGCLAAENYVFPVTEYGHDQGCSIAGGFVYRGKAFPRLEGSYSYGDFCSGNFWTLSPDGAGGWMSDLIGAFPISFSTFGEDADGEIYAADYAGGTIYLLGTPVIEPPPPADFDGDGDTDISVYRPSNGRWIIRGGADFSWGALDDIPVPADYDGDGDVDGAVFRPSTNWWYLRGSTFRKWGQTGDIPVPGDYDGDGVVQVAVFRPSTGWWYIRGGAPRKWGQAGDIPVPGDYSGDGSDQVAIFRPSTGRWYIQGGTSKKWGEGGDIPVPGDYSGDGALQVGVFRPSNGRWYILGEISRRWGAVGDVPVPGDYDGDGAYEVGVFVPSTGRWFVSGMSGVTWGAAGDFPLPARDTNADGDPYQ
jgi:hypothetical protein